MKLGNEIVLMELKNGTLVNGTITGVDMSMDIHLKILKMRVKHSDPISIDTFNVCGNGIQCVIFLDSLPLDILLIDDSPKSKKKENSLCI